MRAILAGMVILGFAITADAAQQPKKADINADKLVGKWAPLGIGGKPELKLTEEFMGDGKFAFGGLKGTYKVEGSTLSITYDVGGTLQRKISKLTDKEVVYGSGKAAITYKKVK